MAKLPIDQYMQDNVRTEQEMKDAMEDVRDVIAEIGGGYTADSGSNWTIETKAISTSVVAVPESQFLRVTSEGAGSSTFDILDKITSTGLPDGRIIYLSNSSVGATYNDVTSAGTNDYITVTHTGSPTGSANIKLADGINDWHLAGKRVLVLVLRDTSGTPYWEEVARFFNGDQASLRSWMGLGDAAEQTMASSISTSGIRGKLLKVSSSATPVDGNALLIDSAGDIDFGSADGGDAATLQTIAASGFVQKADTAEQNILGPLTVKNKATVVQASAGGNAELVFDLDGVEESKLMSIGLTNETNLHTMFGGVIKGGIQIDGINETVSARNSTEAWSPIVTQANYGTGNGIDADKIDGKHLTEVITNLLMPTAANGEGRFELANGSTTILIQFGELPEFGGSLTASVWNNYYAHGGADNVYTFGSAYSAIPYVQLNGTPSQKRNGTPAQWDSAGPFYFASAPLNGGGQNSLDYHYDVTTTGIRRHLGGGTGNTGTGDFAGGIQNTTSRLWVAPAIRFIAIGTKA